MARRSFVRPLLIMSGIVIVSLIHAPASKAGYVPGFTGSVTLGGGGVGNNASGIINFAVFQNTTGNWLAALGVTANTITVFNGTVNQADTFVYLYEIVNTDAANNLAQLKATFVNPSQTITSTGTFNNRIFLDGNGNQIGPAPNQAIGNNGLLGTGTTSSGPGGPASINAIGGTLNSGNNQTSFAWNPQIPPGGFSSIVFVTSNIGPAFVPGSISNNNGGQSIANIPGVVPEPCSFVLLLSGVGVTVLGLRRPGKATRAS